MDIASINALVASLKAAKDIGQGMLELKTAAEVQTKVIQLQGLILEAQSSALDAKTECVELIEENADLKKDNRELRERLEIRERMVFRDNVSWRTIDESESDEGPFCPGCFDGTNHLAARLAERHGDKYWRCPVCSAFIQKPGADQRTEVRMALRIRPYGD